MGAAIDHCFPKKKSCDVIQGQIATASAEFQDFRCHFVTVYQTCILTLLYPSETNDQSTKWVARGKSTQINIDRFLNSMNNLCRLLEKG